MTTNVTFSLTTSDKFTCTGETSTFNPSYRVGQVIFVEDTGRIYLDFHDKRTCYTTDKDGIHYVGIAQTDPTSGSFKLKGETTTYSPNENDMVVYKSIEYIYRKDQDGNLGWYQVGDEESTNWGS